MRMRVCIDPGHGGRDSGAIGPGGLMEKAVALSVGMLLKAGLLPVADVMMTRSDDRLVGLEDRARLANEWGADVFLSIHCNSAPVPAMGIETFIARRTAVSFPLGEALQDAMTTGFPGHADRGLKRANFTVLTETNMAAALVELEFIHVACGEAHLSDRRVQGRYALALAAGLMTFLGIAGTTLPPAADPDEPVACPALAMAAQIRAVVKRLNEIAEVAA